MARRRINPRGAFFLTCLLLALFALLPSGLTGWLTWFRGPLLAVVAPISGPLTHVGRWLRPGDSRRAISEDPEINELRQLGEMYKTEFLRTEQENKRLRAIIEALQQGIAYGPSQRLRLLEAARIGSSAGAGTIEIARGGMDGVTMQTVATAVGAPQHLVGLVSAVGPTVSSIRLVTDERLSPKRIETLLLKDEPVTMEAAAQAPRCQFTPAGDGTLVGILGAQDAQRVNKGDLAYVDDEHWPAGAQRLALARVVLIEETDNPLFLRLILRPDFDLARVRGVILRIPVDDQTSSGPGGTP
jgi:hypothetical protein